LLIRRQRQMCIRDRNSTERDQPRSWPRRNSFTKDILTSRNKPSMEGNT
jgi:hypothetical protein